jgi:uncharacterized membrane protein YgdD (TMEM256/DUF423 family)
MGKILSNCNELLTTGGYLFVVGTVLFSGSLYVLALGGVRWLGAITPVGGTAFIIGWFCLAVAAFWDHGRGKAWIGSS